MADAAKEQVPKQAGGLRVSLDPDSEVIAYVGTEAPQVGQVHGVIVAESTDPETVTDALRNVSATNARLAAVGSRLKADFEDVLQALEEVARAVPAGVEDQEGQLSEHDQATLREAGLLRSPTASRATRASARAAVRYAQLLGTGLSVKEAAARLNVTEGRIRQRLGERSLYGFQSKQGWCLPEFQFSVNGELPGLKKVLTALPVDLHPLSVEGFFVQPKAELVADDEPVSVVDWLAAGRDVARVAELARDVLTA